MKYKSDYHCRGKNILFFFKLLHNRVPPLKLRNHLGIPTSKRYHSPYSCVIQILCNGITKILMGWGLITRFLRISPHRLLSSFHLLILTPCNIFVTCNTAKWYSQLLQNCNNCGYSIRVNPTNTVGIYLPSGKFSLLQRHIKRQL